MNRKNRNKKNFKRLMIILGILLFALLVVLAIIIFRDKDSNDVSDKSNYEVISEQDVEVEIIAENPEIVYQTDEIEVYTIFPSDVINIDADSEFVKNLASVEFKNISGTYLKKCEIQVETADGETYSFLAEDIPAEMEVMAFETSNKTVEEEMEVANFTCSTEVDTSDVLMSDQIEVSEEGIVVTVKNISGKDLSDLVVTCHCMMDETSYGGSKYEYSIEMLNAGETAEIDAVDCCFGQAKVVRISAN